MFLAQDSLRHSNSITHEGKILVFATDAQGQVFYTIKQDGYEDSYGSTAVKGWENWQRLPFPQEPDDPSVIEKEQAELSDSDGNPIVRSRYQTQEQTAIAPVQLVSGLGHIYVFRQSQTQTLLCDRFVLDGLTNTLVRKLDVRFKRSKQKHKPFESDNSNSLTQIDALDFRDTEGNPFYEPTTELSLVNNLTEGWFSVVLVPTGDRDTYRWHIFNYNLQSGQLELTSLRASAEGLFDVQDETVLEPKPGEPGVLIPRSIPGIVKRRFDLGQLKIARGVSATSYDTQVERQTPSGLQLLKDGTRVMVVAGTEEGEALALSFTVATDGTLSQISEQPEKLTTLRNDEREVLLPLNTLDEIKAIAKQKTAPQGTITGMAQTEGNRLQIISSQAKTLKYGDIVQISGTSHYNGYYSAGKVDEQTFEIEANWVGDEAGTWEVLPQEGSGLVFDGIVTAYERTADGKLRLHSPNHGLESGDEVQILNTRAYNDRFFVTEVAGDRFTVGGNWQAGEAVNLKLVSRKRRGIFFGGERDYLDLPRLDLKTPSPDYGFGATYSVWIYFEEMKEGVQPLIVQKDNFIDFSIKNGLATFQLTCEDGREALIAPSPVPTRQWIHCAASFAYDPKTATTSLSLSQDGVEIAQKTIKSIPHFREKWQPQFFVAGNPQTEQFMAGKISDLQIWDMVRSPQTIKDSMYLQLTGREVGLAGYWRLGTISEGNVRQVVDFSVHNKPATVYGDAFVSAITLSRNLSDGKTPAVKYSNADLFAVSQRATYEESFEFKLDDVQLDPSAIDSQNRPLFAIAYWGKTSRSSQEPIEFGGEATGFKKLDGGWYLAISRFTVPDDIKLVRSFEIADIQGKWQSLEIRKHRIRQVSDSITQAEYRDLLKPSTLANDEGDLEAHLRRIDPLERRESILLRQESDLKSQIFLLNDPSLPTRIQQLETAVRGYRSRIPVLEREVTTLEQRYQAEVNNPFNYWHSLTVRSRESRGEAARIYTQDKHFIQGLAWGNHGNQKFRFEKVDGDYYAIICQYENRILDMPRGGDYEIYGNSDHHRQANQQWRLERRSDGYYTIRCRHEGRVMDLRNRSHSVYGHSNHHGQSNQQWKLTNLGEVASPSIANSRIALEAKQRELQQLRAALRSSETTLNELQTLSTNKTAQRAVLEAQLKAVTDTLGTVQTELATLNTAFIQGVNSRDRTPQIMPQLASDRRGLVSQGAILGFVRPASRLQALATSEGNVQINYCDQQGRMRQTIFDATADSRNGAFEQWIPDSVRACLSLTPASSVILLKDPNDQRRNAPIPLPATWTIEAWFAYPLPENERYYTLTRAQNAPDHQVIVEMQNEGQFLGTYVNRQFYSSGFDLRQLSAGWHHLTAVAQGQEAEGTTTFYIDGQPVGNPIKAKSESDIYAIGNIQTGGQPFGKIAEVRIWQVALTPEEVEIHSKTLLSGNEPGLLAYYPLTEAAGDQIRDRSSNGRHAKLQGGAWWACTYPIGHPGHGVMEFNSPNAQIELPVSDRFNLTNNFTLEAWVKTAQFDRIQRVFVKQGAFGFGLNGSRLRFTTYGRRDYDTREVELAPEFWHHIAVVMDSNNAATFYLNGELVDMIAGTQGANITSHACTLGSSPEHPKEYWSGRLAEVRLWNTARSGSEIRSTLHQRLTGTEANLIAYFPLDRLDMTQSPATVTELANNMAGTVREASILSDNTLAIAPSALLVAEYSTIGSNPDNQRKSAIMRRFLACPSLNGVKVFSDKRIEALELRWIGNAQFAPTLLGYIEGAPPVPSENLTLEDNYNGATAVELVQSQDVEYSWNRSQDAGLGASSSLFLGVDSQTLAGVGVETTIESTRAGFFGNLDFTYNFQNESRIGASAGLSITDKLELRGNPETQAKFPHLGKRFVPKNIGYALVVSGLADVFITRLQGSGRMVGYQVLPVDGIPPDVNTITFLINPAYTMNGSLDGLTGSAATSDRFFRHVPEMRSQYGSLYPASYYRLQEAYDLKQQIDGEDARRASYFAQFNARLVDEASVEREVNKGELPQDITVNRPEDDPDEGYTPEQQRERENNIRSEAEMRSQQQAEAAQQKQAEIEAKIQDTEKRTHASESFAGWQRKLEDIQIRSGKRNIVNTYVWDADGGFHAEAQNFASTVEHSIGGSFSLNAGLGFEGEFGSKVTAGLTALATVNLTQTLSKTESRSKGFELNVDLSGVEYRGITNHDDYPLQPGEKVDRYRFMSFYLEGHTNHFHDFFNYVVDPEWLASNDEEARALRQINTGKPNKTWRVLHRVTYVERPALQGFGRELRPLAMPEEVAPVQRLLGKIEQLEQDKQELTHKVNEILALLRSVTSQPLT